jgi:hypothetical protein
MPETLIRLFEDSKQSGICRGCGARMEWFETLTGKRMPMNAGAVPRKSETHEETRRVVAFFAADDSHFTTCPDRAQFSHR